MMESKSLPSLTDYFGKPPPKSNYDFSMKTHISVPRHNKLAPPFQPCVQNDTRKPTSKKIPTWTMCKHKLKRSRPNSPGPSTLPSSPVLGLSTNTTPLISASNSSTNLSSLGMIALLQTFNATFPIKRCLAFNKSLNLPEFNK